MDSKACESVCYKKPILPLLSLKCLARRQTIYVVAQKPVLITNYLPCMICDIGSRKAHKKGICLLTFKEGPMLGLDIPLASSGCMVCCATCFAIQNAHSTVPRGDPCCRNVPSRMEGDPRARIAPWGSSEDRAAHSDDSHSSAGPGAQQQAQDAQPGSRSAAAHKEGEQAPGWGDVGDFPLGTLDARSNAADDQSGTAELQQHYSHRSASTPHVVLCKGRACRPSAASPAQRGSYLV